MMDATTFNDRWEALLASRPSFAHMTLDSMHQVITPTFAMRIEVRYDLRGKPAVMMLTYVSDVSKHVSQRWQVIEGINVQEVLTWQEM